MSPTPEQIAEGASIVKTVAEAALPVLVPFDPLISLVMTAITAHFNATKTWPTEEQVRAALPADYKKLVDDWSAWKPSGDGSLPAPPV
jgi:hypothetical protein